MRTLNTLALRARRSVDSETTHTTGAVVPLTLVLEALPHALGLVVVVGSLDSLAGLEPLVPGSAGRRPKNSFCAKRHAAREGT